MAGVAGEAQLTTIKASMEGRFTDFELAAAIAYAVDTGAKVVNLSLGGTKSSQTEVGRIEYAFAKDVLVVAAAGNEAQSGNPVEYPAAHLQPVGSNGVGGYGLSVGASTITGARAAFSNHGSYISLAAPGEEVFGAISKDSSPQDWPRVEAPRLGEGALRLQQRHVVRSAAGRRGRRARLGREPLRSARVRSRTSSSRPRRAAGSWNPELGYGVINVAAAVEVAAQHTRRLAQGRQVQRHRAPELARHDAAGRARTASSRSDRRARRQVLVPSTTETSQTIQAAKGVTHTFVVESLDAGGAVIARSARAVVTLGQAKSALILTPFKFTERGKRYSLVIGMLATNAPDVKLGRRRSCSSSGSEGAGGSPRAQATDVSGRVIWVVPTRPLHDPRELQQLVGAPGLRTAAR